MLLKDMPKHTLHLGQVKRPDGELFNVSGVVWESPENYNYWQGYYEVRHAQWGAMTLRLYIPKKIAPTIDLAKVLFSGAPYIQVKSEIDKMTAKGRDLIYCPSYDGWHLIG